MGPLHSTAPGSMASPLAHHGTPIPRAQDQDWPGDRSPVLPAQPGQPEPVVTKTPSAALLAGWAAEPADPWGLIQGAQDTPVSWGGVPKRRLCTGQERDGYRAPSWRREQICVLEGGRGHRGPVKCEDRLQGSGQSGEGVPQRGGMAGLRWVVSPEEVGGCTRGPPAAPAGFVCGWRPVWGP